MPLNHSTAALLSPFLPLTQEVIFVDLVFDLERHEAYQKLDWVSSKRFHPLMLWTVLA